MRARLHLRWPPCTGAVVFGQRKRNDVPVFTRVYDVTRRFDGKYPFFNQLAFGLRLHYECAYGGSEDVQNGEQIRKMATLTGVLLMAAAEALAQEKQQPARRIVVSIPDRKLAVMEAGRVLRVFPTRWRAEKPQPGGRFQNRRANPRSHWYGKGRIVPPGKSNRWARGGSA